MRLGPEHAESRMNRALCWLSQGKFERGWAEYEWRWKLNENPRRAFREPVWDGTPLDGKTILLHTEQGIGDAFQFIRFAALVKSKGGSVVLECPRTLTAILSSCPGIDKIAAPGHELPKFDVLASLMSLPAILGTRLDTIPTELPYLFANATLVESWQRELGSISIQGRYRLAREPALQIGSLSQHPVARVRARGRAARASSPCKRDPAINRERRFPIVRPDRAWTKKPVHSWTRRRSSRHSIS